MLSDRFIAERARVCGHGCSTGTEPAIAALHKKLFALRRDDWPLLVRTWNAIGVHALNQARRISRGGK